MVGLTIRHVDVRITCINATGWLTSALGAMAEFTDGIDVFGKDVHIHDVNVVNGDDSSRPSALERGSLHGGCMVATLHVRPNDETHHSTRHRDTRHSCVCVEYSPALPCRVSTCPRHPNISDQTRHRPPTVAISHIGMTDRHTFLTSLSPPGSQRPRTAVLRSLRQGGT